MAWYNDDRYTKGVPRITNYVAARAHFDTVKPRADGSRPAGKRNLTNRLMREHADGSIGISYFDDEIIVYHPDGTIHAQAYTQQRQGTFPELVLPPGLAIDIGTRSGPILFSGRADPLLGPQNRWGLKEMVVMRASTPVHLHLVKDRWEPVDVDALEPFIWQELDKARSRVLSAEWGFGDFIAATDAMAKLGAKLPEWKHGLTMDQLLSRLRERDFPGVIEGLQRDRKRIRKPGGGSMNGPESIRPKAIADLRTHLYMREGALIERRAQMLTHDDYRSVEVKLLRFKGDRYCVKSI